MFCDQCTCKRFCAICKTPSKKIWFITCGHHVCSACLLNSINKLKAKDDYQCKACLEKGNYVYYTLKYIFSTILEHTIMFE